MGDKSRSGAWSDLPLDLLFLVVTTQKQLRFVDIESMAGVCKSWRSMLKENNWFGLGINNKASFPWLMLSESELELTNNRGDGKRGFFNPITGHVAQVYLPEAEGRRCCGSSYGWIITIGVDMEIKLLNPLTRIQLNLPSQLSFGTFTDGTTNEELHAFYSKIEIVSYFIRKIILTCSPTASECMAVAFLFPLEDYQLACCKLNDSSWTLLPGQEADDFMFYQGYLFGVTFCGELMVMDLYHDPQHKWKIISPRLYDTCVPIFRYAGNFYNYYLAEIKGEIVIIVRVRRIQYPENDTAHKTVNVGVFKYMGEEGWHQIKDIGNCCLFLGTNLSICLSPVPRDYFPNSIYFTDDLIFHRIKPPPIRGSDMVKFSLDDTKFSKFYDGTSLSEYSPPIWLTLNP